MTNAETNTAATVAEQGAHVAPEKASSKKQASQRKGAPKGQKAAKAGKAKAAPKKEAKVGRKSVKREAAKATAPRADSKGGMCERRTRLGLERRASAPRSGIRHLPSSLWVDPMSRNLITPRRSRWS
jgi:hypothetical protein